MSLESFAFQALAANLRGHGSPRSTHSTLGAACFAFGEVPGSRCFDRSQPRCCDRMIATGRLGWFYIQ